MTTTPETGGPQLAVHAVTYEVGFFPPDEEASSVFNLTVEYRGGQKWGVIKGRRCLGSDGTWDWEGIPSERTDEWLASHRFDLDAALDLARRHAPQVKVNGKTAEEVARSVTLGG